VLVPHGRNNEQYMEPTNTHHMRCTPTHSLSHMASNHTKVNRSLRSTQRKEIERPISILNPLQQLSNPLFILHPLYTCFNISFVYSILTSSTIIFFSNLLIIPSLFHLYPFRSLFIIKKHPKILCKC